MQGWGQKQEEKPPGAPSHSSHCIELSTTISMAGPDVNMALQARCVLLAQLVLAAGHNCPTCWLSCSWDIAASSCGDVHTASTEQFLDGGELKEELVAMVSALLVLIRSSQAQRDRDNSHNAWQLGASHWAPHSPRFPEGTA